MILRKSYRQDAIDGIKDLQDSLFDSVETSKSAILADDDTIGRIWCLYQKSIEEYGVDPDYALKDALSEVIGTPAPHD